MNSLTRIVIAFLIGFGVGFIVSRALIDPDEACLYISLSGDSSSVEYQQWQAFAKEHDLNVACTNDDCTQLRICTVPPPKISDGINTGN